MSQVAFPHSVGPQYLKSKVSSKTYMKYETSTVVAAFKATLQLASVSEQRGRTCPGPVLQLSPVGQGWFCDTAESCRIRGVQQPCSTSCSTGRVQLTGTPQLAYLNL